MAETTAALTFQDLLLFVAKYYGVASYDTNGVPYIPADDSFNFYECKEIVNEAIRMFIARPPGNGKWRWMHRTETIVMSAQYSGTAEAGAATTLTDSTIATTYADDFFNTFLLYITAGTGIGETATVTDYDGTLGKFTFAALSGGSTPDTTTQYRISRSLSAINGDAARYTLSTAFNGQIAGNINYIADSNHGTTIDWCDINEIVERRELNVVDGYSSKAAVRPYQPTSSTLGSTRKWEIIFDPRPSSAKSVQFPHILQFNKMRMEGGTADAGTNATTLVDATRLEPDDYFNTWVITIISGTGVGSYATVTDYVKSTGTFTVADWLDVEGAAGGTDPTTGSIYVVEPAANLHPAGPQFDEAIKTACLAKCEMEAEDAELGDKYIGYFNEIALPNAYMIDKNAAPRKLGKFRNGIHGDNGRRRDRHLRENVSFNL